jgi:hypothetical protein
VKILIPVDGPPASIRAVKLAIDQVKTVAGANLVIVNVQNPATLGLAEGAGIMPLAWIERRKKRGRPCPTLAAGAFLFRLACPRRGGGRSRRTLS